MQEKLEKSGPRLWPKNESLPLKDLKLPQIGIPHTFLFYKSITNARGDIPHNFINMFIAVWRM